MISLQINEGSIYWPGSGWNVGCHRSAVAGGSLDRQSLCGWSIVGLQSSVQLGFGPILGKLGEMAVELLPMALVHTSLSTATSGRHWRVHLSSASW